MKRDLIRKRSSAVSNAEFAISGRLQKEGVHFLSQQRFCLRQTVPDFFFPDVNLAVYIDGEQVHRKREQKDADLRDRLSQLYGCTVRSFSYSAPLSKKRLDEILTQILDDVEGLRKMKKGGF